MSFQQALPFEKREPLVDALARGPNHAGQVTLSQAFGDGDAVGVGVSDALGESEDDSRQACGDIEKRGVPNARKISCSDVFRFATNEARSKISAAAIADPLTRP